MIIKAEVFKGKLPRIEPHLLPDNGAQVAQNLTVESGGLRPFNVPLFNATPTKTGTKLSLHRFGAAYWFHWITDVNAVRGPIADNAAEVTYFTGDGAPKVTDSSIAVQGGGTNYPNAAYLLGVPAPTTAPVATVQGAAVDPTQAEDRVYVVTFVAQIGSVEMEGPPSPVSGVVSVEPSQTVAGTLPAIPSGAYNFTKKRIYRTVYSGSAGSTEWKFVKDELAASLTFTDDVATVSLGGLLPSTEWDPPPSDMHSLGLHPGGFMFGASGLDVCVSVAYQPHAWPASWRHKLDYPIVSMVMAGNSILVTTTGKPYLIVGTSPDSLDREPIEINQACVSKRGTVNVGYAAVYPSPDGLMVVGPGIAKNATEALMRREDWQAYKPSTILGAWHDGKYFGFYDTGTVQAGFIFDPATEDFTDIDVYATAVFTDKITDTLYLQVGTDIVAWNGGATKKTMTWKGKLNLLPYPANMGIAQVFAAAYPVTFKLYADGTLKHTETVASRSPFRLPGGYLADRYEVELSGANAITAAYVAETAGELRRA